MKYQLQVKFLDTERIVYFPCTSSLEGSVLLCISIFDILNSFCQSEALLWKYRIYHINDDSGVIQLRKKNNRGKDALMAIAEIRAIEEKEVKNV